MAKPASKNSLKYHVTFNHGSATWSDLASNVGDALLGKSDRGLATAVYIPANLHVASNIHWATSGDLACDFDTQLSSIYSNRAASCIMSISVLKISGSEDILRAEASILQGTNLPSTLSPTLTPFRKSIDPRAANFPSTLTPSNNVILLLLSIFSCTITLLDNVTWEDEETLPSTSIPFESSMLEDDLTDLFNHC
jgi:hypothetical protein